MLRGTLGIFLGVSETRHVRQTVRSDSIINAPKHSQVPFPKTYKPVPRTQHTPQDYSNMSTQLKDAIPIFCIARIPKEVS